MNGYLDDLRDVLAGWLMLLGLLVMGAGALLGRVGT